MIIELRNQLRRIWREPVFWLIPFVLAVIFLIPMQTGNHMSTVQRLQTEARMTFPDTEINELKSAVAQEPSKANQLNAYRHDLTVLNAAARAGNRTAFANVAAKMARLTATITNSPLTANVVPFQYLAKHHLPVYFAEEQRQVPATIYLTANVTPISNSVMLLLVLGATVAYLMLLPHLHHDDDLTAILPRRRGLVLSVQVFAVLISTFGAYLVALVLTSILPVVHAGFGSLRYPVFIYRGEHAVVYTTGQLIGGQILQVGAFLILFVGVSALLRELRASLVLNVVVILGIVLLAEAPFVTSAAVQPAAWLRFFPSTYVWMQTVLTRDGSVSLISALRPLAGGLLVVGYGVVAYGVTLLISKQKLSRFRSVK